MNWKESAKHKYYTEHMSIGVIADIVGVTRQSVSAYLKSCPEWQTEQEYRSTMQKKRRRQQQMSWDRTNRSVCFETDIFAIVRREHAQAVTELSREKYH